MYLHNKYILCIYGPPPIRKYRGEKIIHDGAFRSKARFYWGVRGVLKVDVYWGVRGVLKVDGLDGRDR
jgi:hypothetical protein